jgi:hypothetical protein
MDDTMIRMMRLAQKGFTCSQILLLLALEARGEQNPALVRAAAGLAYGCGTGKGSCGVLTGGSCRSFLIGSPSTSEVSTEGLSARPSSETKDRRRPGKDAARSLGRPMPRSWRSLLRMVSSFRTGANNSKSLLTSLYKREGLPLFDKEGPGEILRTLSIRYRNCS